MILFKIYINNCKTNNSYFMPPTWIFDLKIILVYYIINTSDIYLKNNDKNFKALRHDPRCLVC